MSVTKIAVKRERMRLTQPLSVKVGAWKIISRQIAQSAAFIDMSYAGRLTVLYAYNLLRFESGNYDTPCNAGIIELTDIYLEALGLLPDDIPKAKTEIVEHGFFVHISGDVYQVSEAWRDK